LFNKSIVYTSGCEILSKPMANGTVLRIIGSPYYSKWCIVLMHISYPISSPKEMSATPITAAI